MVKETPLNLYNIIVLSSLVNESFSDSSFDAYLESTSWDTQPVQVGQSVTHEASGPLITSPEL